MLITIFVILLILKLLGVLNLSWVWVTSPLWMPFVLGFIASAIVCVIDWILMI